MSKARVTLTLDTTLVGELDEIADERQTSRTRVVEEAIRSLRGKILERELVAGYRAMSRELQRDAEARLAAGYEALR
jgi:predicted transcriptional regulator